MAQGDLLGAVMQSDIGAAGAAGVANWDATTPRAGKGIQLLDNGYFVGGGTGYGFFPVNQRRQTQYSATSPAQPAFDRWKVSFTTATLTANGVKIVSTGGYGLLQYLPAGIWDSLVGKTVTLSALVTANSGDLKFYSGSTLQATRTGTGVLSATFVVPSGFQETSKFIGIYGNATISAAKLELGSQQTLARKVGDDWVLNDPPPNYQQELAKCQRYFQVFRTQSLRPTYGIDFRPPMAADTPTLSSFVKDTVTYYTASAEL